jgi:hypothetical protein
MLCSRWKLGHVKNSRWINSLAACLIVWGIVAGQTPHASWTYDSIIMSDAPGAGKDAGQDTSPQGLNHEGEIAGYYKDGASVVHGFVRHSGGTFSTFDVPGASQKPTLGTFPQGINENGDVAGYFFTDPNGVRDGFVRHKDGHSPRSILLVVVAPLPAASMRWMNLPEITFLMTSRMGLLGAGTECLRRLIPRAATTRQRRASTHTAR